MSVFGISRVLENTKENKEKVTSHEGVNVCLRKPNVVLQLVRATKERKKIKKKIKKIYFTL